MAEKAPSFVTVLVGFCHADVAYPGKSIVPERHLCQLHILHSAVQLNEGTAAADGFLFPHRPMNSDLNVTSLALARFGVSGPESGGRKAEDFGGVVLSVRASSSDRAENRGRSQKLKLEEILDWW
ncbi:hypothetical protein R1flu_001316 [Riccia fluitans]|uniref:Uncharacterized protein n=1 Tax=Riccia fluitans TaxID=41844 RepID=A0ABD1Y2Y4_9MARC